MDHGTPSRLSVGAGSCGWNTPTPCTTWTEGTPSFTESTCSGVDLGQSQDEMVVAVVEKDVCCWFVFVLFFAHLIFSLSLSTLSSLSSCSSSLYYSRSFSLSLTLAYSIYTATYYHITTHILVNPFSQTLQKRTRSPRTVCM